MPLALLNSAAAASSVAAARRFPAGPIHHTPQAGRFRYSPLASVTGGSVGSASAQDLLTTSALLQMAQAQALTGSCFDFDNNCHASMSRKCRPC